ncbi:hypothetical protein [Gordonia tangerina]|uniref:Nucleic acid-binding protein n=1 Tax=Gordonia tangerina TaxID=2911060 RepID=A0ABS9DPG8_9ACTN|nr:hypothetical protein [Gordonia tangerina]MCF3941108.1 hypothetical protein [Gordonia tangerina]
MTSRPIIDAGPALNFLAINKERLLIDVLGPICTPETVRDEVLQKARTDNRFTAVTAVWNKLPGKYLEILSDDATPELIAAVARITGLPFAERKRSSRDLGETMVVAHAAVRAFSGQRVIVIIDDQQGARLAQAERARLDRLRNQGQSVGAITVVNTTTILMRAAGGKHLPDRAAMRAIYQRLREHDDGLVPISETGLLGAALWEVVQ